MPQKTINGQRGRGKHPRGGGRGGRGRGRGRGRGSTHNSNKKQQKITQYYPTTKNNKGTVTKEVHVTVVSVEQKSVADCIGDKLKETGKKIKKALTPDTNKNNNTNHNKKSNYKHNNNHSSNHKHQQNSHNNTNNNSNYNHNSNHKGGYQGHHHNKYHNNNHNNTNNNNKKYKSYSTAAGPSSSNKKNMGNWNSSITFGASMNDNSSEDDNTSNNYKLYPLPCKSQKRWQQIVTILSKPTHTKKDLIQTLYSLSGAKQKKNLSCSGLDPLLNNFMTQSEQKKFFEFTLPFITECALNLPAVFPANEVNLLYEGVNGTIELTEEQVASLLAMSFFGLHTWERGTYFPRFRITNLFGYREYVHFEKIKCIIHYFNVLATEKKIKAKNGNNLSIDPSLTRTISIYRHIPRKHEYDTLQNQYLKSNETMLCDFEFKIRGSIEDCENALQVDFANKYIGGGVLGSGCVQEEIRFLINPECLVSLLFCQCMRPNEAIAVVGTRQFAKYKGYGSSFEFNGNHIDKTPTHQYGKYYKLRNCIIAIDAEKFYNNQLWMQYKENKMKRELLKCYTGFSIPTAQTNLDESKEADGKLWIATGNWGCGVFGGDIELKCVIQWMGASLACRKIKYFAFGDRGCKFMESFVEIVKKNQMMVGTMWRLLCQYGLYRKNMRYQDPKKILSVFQFIVAQINKRNKDSNLNKKYELVADPQLVNPKKPHLTPPKNKDKKIQLKEKKEERRKMKDFLFKAENNENNNETKEDNAPDVAIEPMDETTELNRRMSLDENTLDDDHSSCGLEAGGDDADGNQKVDNNNTMGCDDNNDAKENFPDLSAGNAQNDGSNKERVDGNDTMGCNESENFRENFVDPKNNDEYVMVGNNKNGKNDEHKKKESASNPENQNSDLKVTDEGLDDDGDYDMTQPEANSNEK